MVIVAEHKDVVGWFAAKSPLKWKIVVPRIFCHCLRRLGRPTSMDITGLQRWLGFLFDFPARK